MTESTPIFEIHISTKNRKDDLLQTLSSLEILLERDDVTCVVFDDGSTDGTSEAVKNRFPKIILKRNDLSKGYMFCRNAMLDQSNAQFAISLDDDANFVSADPLENISAYFENNDKCGLVAFRIFWGKSLPCSIGTDEKPLQVNSYVGCGHAWRVSAWREIPSYPEWFEFYGEENFASQQLFKKGYEVHYVPQVLVQHRVEILERRKQKDYAVRLRRSLRSGWYSYFLFLPWRKIPRKMAYSTWSQLKFKVLKGDFRALKALVQAKLDLLASTSKIFGNANRMSSSEYERWVKIPEARIYWKPKNKL
ncbi:MAG: glycosyltransferase [Flavobacterium sp.]|uniref:glycosyltransferase family 2 protein n=1 Tax=Flavobacterium sp. TaxID=239 RepID=UPI0011F9B9EA|nr:glycosyltransferase [Flavobacterium sp.]RZJ66081.1 MAG: glycosyltransferase [Flavobacterium sp.]